MWGGNFGKINQIIYDPQYNAPDALRRNALLKTRNEWAKKLALPQRKIHNFDKPSTWFMHIDGQPIPNYDDGELRPTQFHVMAP